jgi:FAD/FMN-containing dehydrogenase
VRGHFPDDVSSLQSALGLLGQLRDAAHEHRGHVTVLDCDSRWKASIPVFEFAADAARMMHSVKAAMDPDDLLNRRRLFQIVTEGTS